MHDHLSFDEDERFLSQITDMNKRWQEYNNQRDAYVKTLMGENAEIRKRLSDNENSQVPPHVQIEMNKILDEARRLSRTNEEQKQLASRANSERDKVSNKSVIESAACCPANKLIIFRRLSAYIVTTFLWTRFQFFFDRQFICPLMCWYLLVYSH